MSRVGEQLVERPAQAGQAAVDRARHGTDDGLGARRHLDEADRLALGGLRERERQGRPGVAPAAPDALGAVQVAERDVVHPGEGRGGDARRPADRDELALAVAPVGPGHERVRHHGRRRAGRPAGQVGPHERERRRHHGAVAALLAAQGAAAQVGLQVGHGVHEPVPHAHGLPAARRIRAHVKPAAGEQRRREAQPLGRVVVARDDDDGRHLRQPGQRVVGEPDGVHGRDRPVVQVARDHDGVRTLGPREPTSQSTHAACAPSRSSPWKARPRCQSAVWSSSIASKGVARHGRNLTHAGPFRHMAVAITTRSR
jgi:hypothetical protein